MAVIHYVSSTLRHEVVDVYEYKWHYYCI